MPTSLPRPQTATRWLSAAVSLLLLAALWAVGRTASAASWTVQAKDFAFTPMTLTVAVGDTVTWRNGDAESHAVQGGSLASPEIPAGGSYSATFTAPEELTYFCRFHTYMTGTIKVVEGAAATTTAPAITAPPPPTAPPTPTRAAAPAPASAPAPSTAAARPSGAAFQEVPDDPSARRPPGAPAPAPSPGATGATAAPTSAAPARAATPTTAARPAPTASTTAPAFQEVSADATAAHAPVQLASAQAPAPGGDGIVLARATETGGVKEFRLTMDEATVEVSPGVVKPAYAFNGTVPGPTLKVNEGDRVRIVVDNRLPFATSTHWHGMVLPNEQDGVGGITQPHIEPGAQFVYEWTAVATGTHWYHAHSSGRHVGKGLYGGLQVVPEEDEIEADRDYLLMLGDTDLGFTLNGRSFPSTPTLPAEVGETVRLRLVNTGDQVHAIHLHGVPFQVVAQDGIRRLRPESMDTLTISPGQTFDLLFEQVHAGKWLLHCHMFVHSHVNADAHPPGDSGMAGMAALLDVAPFSGGRRLSALPIARIATSDAGVAGLLALVVVSGLLVTGVVARRRSA